MTTNTAASLHASPRRAKSKKGQTLVEYSLILAIISVLAISSFSLLGQQVKGLYAKIDLQLNYALAAIN